MGELRISRLNYVPRYLAWEGVDQLTPDDAGINARVRFTLNSNGSGTHTISNDLVVIEKSITGAATRRLLENAQGFAEADGQQVDFKVQIESVTDAGGQVFPKNVESGVSLTVFLGNKKVQVGFFDCGFYGKQVAILPSSGLASDIIEQTEIGRRYSAPVDWTQMTQYRLIVRGHDRIELIIGTPLSPVAISIPWVNDVLGFELPVDVSTPRLAFGHSGGDTSSISKWSFVRWGLSNGFEAAVQQEYPDGYPKYLFGGRAFIKSEFDET